MTELERYAAGTQPAGQESERPLIVRARGGDDGAFATLARRYAERIRRWAFVVLGDADDADDVLQEVLIRLHRGLGRFDGRARLSTWLYRVTRNVSLGLVRTRRRRIRRLAVVDAESTPEGEPRDDHLSALVAGESAQIVRGFFHELTERQRAVFTMVDLEGRSTTEVADLLGTAASTVRVHLLKARRTLRRRILEAHPAFREDT